MYLQIDGARLYFDVTGPKLREVDGAAVEVPTLLILHGGPGMDHMTVKRELLPLADVAQLVWYDHRGNGRSDGVDRSRWKLSQWADDVVDFCDRLGIEKPIVLGNSFGGHVTAAYGIRHPEHASKLVISSMGAHWDAELSMSRFEERGGKPARRVAEGFWFTPSDATLEAYRNVCFPLYNQPRAKDYVAPPVIARPELTQFYLGPGSEFRTLDLRADLARIVCPVLVLAGKLDPVIPWELSRDLADALVNAKVSYEQFDDAGHGVWRDNPERALSILRDFITTP